MVQTVQTGRLRTCLVPSLSESSIPNTQELSSARSWSAVINPCNTSETGPSRNPWRFTLQTYVPWSTWLWLITRLYFFISTNLDFIQFLSPSSWEKIHKVLNLDQVRSKYFLCFFFPLLTVWRNRRKQTVAESISKINEKRLLKSFTFSSGTCGAGTCQTVSSFSFVKILSSLVNKKFFSTHAFIV